MVSGRPLLPGGTNEEQLGLIWRLLGSPDLVRILKCGPAVTL
jgi:hypothetical protein